jgi:Xaa-Pro aminopeptidase
VSERYAKRMARVAEEAAAQGFAAVVVSPSPDLAYLTGYTPMPMERPTLLVLRSDAGPAMVVPQLERPLAVGSPAGALVELIGWDDGSDPFQAVSLLLPARGRIAAGDRMWAAHLLGLQRAVPGASFEAASPVIGKLRSVKDADELDALKRAGAAADEVFRRICGFAFLGRSERQIATDVGELLVATGHDRAEFMIVASGPNAASPHHEPGERSIKTGDAVLLDFGGELAGYFSDTTRTVVVGESPPGFDGVFRVVKDAQEAAFLAVRPGVSAQEIDRVARRLIVDAGYGERFIHRTGHGIGLEVHEPPYLVEGNDSPLEAGTTFSIEPGIYLEGAFGVRIEDIVVVTEDGAERLNRSTRELQVVT